MVVKDIAGDEDEVALMLGSLVAKLLEGSKASLANSKACAFFESGDAHPKVEIRGVQEPNHCVSFLFA
jgi:hypothetical protein